MDAAAKLLFKCPDHGGLRHARDLVIFPGAELVAEEEDADAVGSGGRRSVLGSVLGGGSKPARQEMEEPSALTTPAEPKTMVTDISIEAQVRARIMLCCVADHEALSLYPLPPFPST